ncbi:MAG: hypothetical protein AABX51_04695 [Nanoarchaeota archaeon]
MDKLFPTYEVGSMPKLEARVKALAGQEVTEKNIAQVKYFSQAAGIDDAEIIDVFSRLNSERRKPNEEERDAIANFNALLNIKLEEKSGLDFVYDGEGRRIEMYRHMARQISGFEDIPEMIRSRGPDSYKKSICVAPPKLLSTDLLFSEFNFTVSNANTEVKVPINEPYMMAVMSDNAYYLQKARKKLSGPAASYEAKRNLTLELARNVVRPQVELLAKHGAKWIQLDAPAATLDLAHIPIFIEGLNESVAGIDDVTFSVHLCYPRRVSLTEKSGYELLFPHLESLDRRISHLSLELANAGQYERDLAPFKSTHFSIGAGVIDITAERAASQTPEMVAGRLHQVADILGDASRVYAAHDCGLRQLSLEEAVRLDNVLVEGAALAR